MKLCQQNGERTTAVPPFGGSASLQGDGNSTLILTMRRFKTKGERISEVQ